MDNIIKNTETKEEGPLDQTEIIIISQAMSV